MLNPTQSTPQSVSTGANAVSSAMPRPPIPHVNGFKKTNGRKYSNGNGNGFLSLFLNDKWWLRKTMALGNELAESAKEAMHNWLPKPMTAFCYRLFWSLAIVCAGFRAAANTVHAPKQDKLKAGVKMLLHDTASTLIAPTIVANIANSLQNWVYNMLNLPSMIKDTLRTAGSLAACNFTIDLLDKPARNLAAKALNMHDDHHKEVNDKAKAKPRPKTRQEFIHRPNFASAL